MLLDKLSTVNESLFLLDIILVVFITLLSGAVIMAIFNAPTAIEMVRESITGRQSKAFATPLTATNRKRVWMAMASSHVIAALVLGHMASIHLPNRAEVEAQKAALCERTFTKFVEQQDAEFGYAGLEAGCDRDQLLVIAVAHGGDQGSQAAYSLLSGIK